MKKWIPADFIPYNDNGALTLEDQYYILSNNIDEQNKQIEKNTNEITNIENIITGFVDNFLLINDEIKKLETSTNKNSAKIININNDITGINTNINAINTNIDNLTTKTNNNTTNISKINNEITKINQNITDINNKIELIIPLSYDINNTPELFEGETSVITGFTGTLDTKNNLFTFSLEIPSANINQIFFNNTFSPKIPIYSICGLASNDLPIGILINTQGQLVGNTQTSELTYLYITASYICNGFT